MPNYKTHTAFNLLLVLPLLLIPLYYFLHPKISETLIFTSAFAYTTLFMNPDLDLAHKINICSLRGVLSLPFRLYSRIFRHRGISHSILLGSLTRILWALVIGCFLYLFCLWLWHFDSPLPWVVKHYTKHKPYFFYGFGGVFFADAFHILLDKLK